MAAPNAARCDRASLRRKLVWLAGAQSRQCPGEGPEPPSRPGALSYAGPFTRGAGLHFTSGTNIRTTRKPRPLWARQRWGQGVSLRWDGRALTAHPRPSGGDSCTPLQELSFALHANQAPSGLVSGGGRVLPSCPAGGGLQGCAGGSQTGRGLLSTGSGGKSWSWRTWAA